MKKSLLSEKVTDLRKVYQIRVTLLGTEPMIWRRLELTSDTTLGKLHRILLAAMGWTGRHQHRFTVGRNYYGIPDPDQAPELKSEEDIRLSCVAPKKERRFIYEYDPGDNWRHEILVEKILPLKGKMRYPVCVNGDRACPPENIGGIFRYLDFLEALDNKAHPAHKVMRQWVGDAFDPDVFDIEAANDRLAKII